MPRVTECFPVGGFALRLTFADGTQGEIDLFTELEGPIFEPLRDPNVFARCRVHPELHTVVWPNGADFAPEFLYDHLKVLA